MDAGETDDNGDPIATTNRITLTDSDLAEWRKMQVYTPSTDATSNDAWWQNLIKFGISKAIDNTLPGQQASGIQGNTKPGSFAGQNGRTYDQRGSQAAPPTPAGVVNVNQAAQSLGGWPVVLLAGAAIWLFALHKG